MGAWGALAFDNDPANDWAYDLDGVADLSLVESALADVEAVGDDYLELDVASNALAATEVLARLRGRPGYSNPYTAKVDQWVAAHPEQPSGELVERATAVLDRIVTAPSELRELWDETPTAEEWRRGVEDLRSRLVG
ncbi:MAG: DUF4259 domain-containing protein [Candidatus Dormibacteraeota bacterium]|uniref:DUF4259 domain-containing protein n=1 Tax=Candidatus Amunia macphersoniae TaxID=3127014 RepID=A0A934KMV7_9BACT|nr:DUF4259 domain-containing protein [Candidatus Dormibacteraeota bacterium]